MEMDVWLQVGLGELTQDKSLTLVITPFKKSCASRDLLYRQCRYCFYSVLTHNFELLCTCVHWFLGKSWCIFDNK